MLRKLSVRIAILISVLGGFFLLMALVAGTVYVQAAQPHSRIFVTILELFGVAFGIPLILGVVVAHIISDPIHEFANVAAKLRESSYKLHLEKSDIAEFDGLTDELNLLASQLQKEEELRRNLVSDTSHELNTPLTALSGQLKAMREGVLDVTPDRLEMIGGQVERLQEMVARMQEYADIRSHAIRLHLKRVHMQGILENVQKLYQESLRANGMHLAVKVTQDTITADPHLLVQVISNLVGNAIQHSECTQITILVDQGSLTITDDGRGIPEKSLAHVFERFYRVDASRSRETGGLGLGLAIIKEIVEAHGWRIVVLNQNPGTLFKIYFTLSHD